MKYLLIFLLLSTSVNAAQTFKNNKELLNATTTGTVSASVVMQDNLQGFYVEAKASNVSGTSETFDIVLTHSRNDSEYYSLASFPQITVASNILITVDSNIMKYLKYTVTVGGSSPTADIELNVIYDNVRRND